MQCLFEQADCLPNSTARLISLRSPNWLGSSLIEGESRQPPGESERATRDSMHEIGIEFRTDEGRPFRCSVLVNAKFI